MSDIANTFAKSPHKAAKLRDIVASKGDSKAGEKVVAIKSYIKTRWTSFYESLDRILELSSSLQQYFTQNSKTDKKKAYLSSENILMLRLLRCLVLKLTGYIKFLETENLDVTTIASRTKSCIADIGDFLFQTSDFVSDTQGSLKNYDQVYLCLEPVLHNQCNESSDHYK